MGSPSDLFIVVDMQGRRLVAFNGSPQTIPDQFQSDTVSLKIQCVNPSSTTLPLGSSPYVVQDMAGSGLRVAIGQTPTGTPGGPAPLALQDTFVWDTVNQWFTADLPLNNSSIDTYIGALAQIGAYFEITQTVAGNRKKFLQTTFTLRAVVDEGTSTVPPGGDVFLTKAEQLAYFFPIVGTPGMTLTFVSPDGTKKRELGVNNDGSAMDNLIQ